MTRQEAARVVEYISGLEMMYGPRELEVEIGHDNSWDTDVLWLIANIPHPQESSIGTS